MNGSAGRGIGVLCMVASAVLTAGLTGCAGLSGSLPSDAPAEVKQAAVATQAAARWEALIRGDFETAYGYMTQASREVVPLASFRARRQPVAIQSAKVVGVTCGAEICKADVLLTYDHRTIKGGATQLNETWIWEKGRMAYVDPIR
jgi:hypothetical protein